MNTIKITYKDFKIGQKVICTNRDESYDEWLTVGKEYKIKDLDFHFWDAICIKADNKQQGFYPIKFFTNEEELIRLTREKKLKRIINKGNYILV